MIRAIVGVLLFVTFGASAQNSVTLDERTQIALLRGSSTVATHTSWEACRADAERRARAETQTSGSRTFSCQTERRQLVATYSPAQPPPTCGPLPTPDTRSNTCPAGTTGSWIQTRSYTTAPYPTCAVQGEWLPAAAPEGACVAVPPTDPPPPVAGNPLTPAVLAAIPWHNGAGAWGPQVRLEFPAQPVTTRTVSVSTLQQFNEAARVPGTLINVTVGWAGNTTATISANDIDVVLGANIGAIELGFWPRMSRISRIRVTSAAGGRFRMGQWRDGNLQTSTGQDVQPTTPLASDITLDGIDLNGNSAFGGGETGTPFRTSATRIAVLNVRALSAKDAWLGAASHAVVYNSNLFHGAAAAVGTEGGWGIRNSAGPFTILHSRIQGTRYNNIRLQTSGRSGEVLYVGRTVFVNTVEGGRTAWLWNNTDNSSSAGQAAIIEDSAVYSYLGGGCSGYPDLSARNVVYSRVRRTQFFSAGAINWSQQTLNGMEKRAGGDHDWSQGNTFIPFLTSLPPWSGPGDPTQLPLASGVLAPRGTGACATPF